MTKFLSYFFIYLMSANVFAFELKDVPKGELDNFKEYSEATIEVMQKKGYEEFGLDEKSLKILDSSINDEAASYSQRMINMLPDIYGSYLGELIIQTYGGKWAYWGNTPVVVGKSGIVSFPHQKVYKHITNGAEDSIYAFYGVAGTDEANIPSD